MKRRCAASRGSTPRAREFFASTAGRDEETIGAYIRQQVREDEQVQHMSLLDRVIWVARSGSYLYLKTPALPGDAYSVSMPKRNPSFWSVVLSTYSPGGSGDDGRITKNSVPTFLAEKGTALEFNVLSS